MVPAAAVIPSLLAYVKFVAFKKLVVEPIWFIDLVDVLYLNVLVYVLTCPHGTLYLSFSIRYLSAVMY